MQQRESKGGKQGDKKHLPMSHSGEKGNAVAHGSNQANHETQDLIEGQSKDS